MTAHSFDLEQQKLNKLQAQVVRIAEELARLSSVAEGELERSSDGSSPDLPAISAESVKRLIQARAQRKRYLPDGEFADPSWDILLDLLHAELRGAAVSTSSVCFASGVPQTTALRWIKSMVAQGLIKRRYDPVDGRRIYLELDSKVSASLRRYFLEVIDPLYVSPSS